MKSPGWNYSDGSDSGAQARGGIWPGGSDFEDIDYAVVEKELDRERERSIRWLEAQTGKI